MFRLIKARQTSWNETIVGDQPRVKSIGPWSEILEDWVISGTENSSVRGSRVMKLGDTALKVTANKVSPPNKRDVSETDLYLLGKKPAMFFFCSV